MNAEYFRTIYDDKGAAMQVYRGIGEWFLELPRLAQDPHIFNWVPDAESRFSDVGETWRFLNQRLGQGSIMPYWLVSPSGSLGGYGWGRVQPLVGGQDMFEAVDACLDGAPRPKDTIEFRLAKRYRQRGLAEQFAAAIVVDYAIERTSGPQPSREVFNGLWARTFANNTRAIQVCQSLDKLPGKEPDASMVPRPAFEIAHTDARHATMVMPMANIRSLTHLAVHDNAARGPGDPAQPARLEVMH